MVAGKKTHKNTPVQTRNLKKAQLGGVIFGCTDSTSKECLSKQIFGLPGPHFVYVKNIDPGLPLFLFNYSERALHGIFEAASPGQMNINPYGWTTDGSERTAYPAQVQIRVRTHCRPLLETQFSPIIRGNYYTPSHFRFELDHVQVSKLISLFSSQVIAPSPSVQKSTGNWNILNPRGIQPKFRESNGTISSDAHVDSTPYNKSNGHLNLTDVTEMQQPFPVANEKDELQRIDEKLQKLVVNSEPSDSYPERQAQESSSSDTTPVEVDGSGSQKSEMSHQENVEDGTLSSSDYPSIIAQLILEVQELKTFKQEATEKICQMEQKLRKFESNSQQTREHGCMALATTARTYTPGTLTEFSVQHQDLNDFIILAGGYNGKSWLTSFEAYCPSLDIIKPFCQMTSARSYASLARLNDNIYVIGGGPGGCEDEWYNTVECYNPLNNNWTSLACLNEKKGSLATATLHDRIFALGGGNGIECFSDVEMFDLDVGRWIPGRSMLQKRFALAAVEFNGALYAAGGFDGKDYLSSAERFDPREHSWSKLGSMNSKRGCHSMVVLNEKLYAVGGFNGSKMVDTVEVLDPRRGTWMTDESMIHQRGYSSVVVLNSCIYVIGGLDESQNIVEEIESYKEGRGWQATGLKAIGKRCFASAISLQV